MSRKRIHTFETFYNKEEESGGLIVRSCAREVKVYIDRLFKKGDIDQQQQSHVGDRWELSVFVHNNRHGGERTVEDMKGAVLGKIQWLRLPFMPVHESNTLCIHTSRGYIHVVIISRHSGRNPNRITVQINGQQHSTFIS